MARAMSVAARSRVAAFLEAHSSAAAAAAARLAWIALHVRARESAAACCPPAARPKLVQGQERFR
jgi:hypothetical protein